MKKNNGNGHNLTSKRPSANVDQDVEQFMLVQGLTKELAFNIKQEIIKYREHIVKGFDTDSGGAKSPKSLESKSLYGVPFVNKVNHKRSTHNEKTPRNTTQY